MTRSNPGTCTRVLSKATKWGAALAVVVAIGAGALLLRPAPTQEESSTGVTVARPVRVVKTETSEPIERQDFPGVTKELRESKLAFRVSGPLCLLDVKLGQRLAEGDVIARIDPRDFELAVARVEAGLSETEAGLKAMRNGARAEDIAALEARLAGAGSKLNEATLFRDRFASLVKDGSVPKSKFDNAVASFDVAQAELKATEKQLEKAHKGARIEEIEGMEAKIAGLKTQLAAARNALHDTRLLAPFDGYVSQKYVENYETVAAGHPIVSLLDCSSIDVTAGLPEDVVIRQDRFRNFACELDAYPGRWFPAALKEIGPAIQHGKLTYPVTVTLKLPADLIVRPGMTARVQIEIGQGDSPVGGFRLPAAATVLGDDGKPCVWVVDSKENVVHRQPVAVGKLTNEGVEITGGLTPGQWVVTAGAPLLHEGQHVKMEILQAGSGDQAASEGKAP